MPSGNPTTFELTLSPTALLSVSAALTAFQNGTLSPSSPVYISDLAANVQANLDALAKLTTHSEYVSISLTDPGTPILTLTELQRETDAPAVGAITGSYSLAVTGVSASAAPTVAGLAHVGSVAVSDSAVNVTAQLDTLQSLATASTLAGISLTDSGVATLSITPSQLAGDTAALGAISGNFAVSVSASAPNLTLTGVPGHGTTAVFSKAIGNYTITPSGDGVSFTVTDTGTGRMSVDHLSNVENLQFADTGIFAENAANANVARLYSAAFNRAPDVAGLHYWESVYAVQSQAMTSGAALSAIGATFVSSAEFQKLYGTLNNDAFNTQLYQNVLGRAPDSAGLAYWDSVLASGTTRGDVLVSFAESGENVAHTAYSPTHTTGWLLLI